MTTNQQTQAATRVARIGEALDRFYRPERLARDADTRARIIADRTDDLRRYGRTVLASRHDAIMRRALWISPAPGGGFLVTEVD